MYRIAIESSKRVDHVTDEVPFSFGNPSVEHVTGILHLYRQDLVDGKQVWSLTDRAIGTPLLLASMT